MRLRMPSDPIENFQPSAAAQSTSTGSTDYHWITHKNFDRGNEL